MKRMFLIPALLSLAACGLSPEEHFAQARSAFTAHDFAAAREHLTAVLAERPGDNAALLLQARTLVELGEGDAARVVLEKLFAGNPPQGEIAELAGRAALLRRNPDAALQLLGDSSSVEAERIRAIASLQKQDLDGAEKHLALAVAAGGSAPVFADYARVMLIRNDLAKAADMQAKAEQLGPDQLATLLTGGEIAVRKGDLGRALTYFNKADQLYPKNIAAMTDKAQVLGDLGRTAEFEAALKPLAEAAPNDPTVIYLRARLALAHKDWNGVRAIVDNVASELRPDDSLRLVYAEALIHSGQAEQAIAQAGPFVRAHPESRLALRLLAEAQFAAGDAATAQKTLAPIASSPLARPDEVALQARIAKSLGDPAAVQYAQRARMVSPQALGADVADADTAMRKGDWAKAAAAYDRILAVTDGRNVIVLNNLAYAQSMLGNHDKALDTATRAIKLAPDNASVLDTVAMVRLRSGQGVGEAKRLLRTAAEKAPGNAAIRAHLAEAEKLPG